MSPHGKPDWGVDWTPRKVWGLDDLGEHAVRLGSPHLWDRRGDVLWMTSFDEGLVGFGYGWSGAGGGIELWTGENRQGPYMLKMIAGSNLLEYAWIRKSFTYPVLSRVGWEMTFSVSVDTEFWEWAVSRWDAAGQHVAAIQWVSATSTLQYYNRLGGWTPFAVGVTFRPVDFLENTVKLVVDYSTDEYVQFLCNDQEYGLTGIPCRVAGAGVAPHAEVHVHLESDTGKNAYGFVDNLILTQNEP